MNLAKYNGKYVRILDVDGNTFLGRAKYANLELMKVEWGLDEEGILIEDTIIGNSQIESIETIAPNGSVELWTERLILRRYRIEDAKQLYLCLGLDGEMSKFSGWNPYATIEMAEHTIQRFIDSYQDEHSYSWVMEINGDDVIVGTIGAYEYNDGKIEVGFSVGHDWQARGLATEALKAVLLYLTKNEKIACVTAWCAAENVSSCKVMEKSGMKLVDIEKNGLIVDDKRYDKMIYEYKNLQD